MSASGQRSSLSEREARSIALAAAVAIHVVALLALLSGRHSILGDSGLGEGSGGSGAGGDIDSLSLRPAGWIRQPTEAEMLAAWPRSAIRDRSSGEAILHCWIRPSGEPRRCKVASQTPTNAGFGKAALRLSRVFLIRPVMQEGAHVDVPVVAPVWFTYRRK